MKDLPKFLIALITTISISWAIGALYNPLIENEVVVLSFFTTLLLVMFFSFRFREKAIGYGILSGIVVLIVIMLFVVVMASQLH